MVSKFSISGIEKKTQGKRRPSNLIWTLVPEVLDRKRRKILTPEQILQRLTLAQVKAGNSSENLLNEICQIIYSLYWGKEITKKVYNNIMNSIK